MPIELRAGTYDSGGHKARSFMKFNTTAWNGKQIVSANLILRNWLSLSCGGSAIRASVITQSWSAGSLTWANQPQVSGSDDYDYSPAYGGPTGTSCNTVGDAVWNMKSAVQKWANGTVTNNGIRLTAVSETVNASWRRYRSSQVAAQGNWPKFSVTYKSFPKADPPAIYTYPISSAGYSRSVTPKLSARVTDYEGGSVRAKFYVYQGSTLKWTSPYSQAVFSGQYTNVVVPASAALTNGTTYTVRALAADLTTDALTQSAATTFTIDTSLPSATVTATGFANNTWATTAPGSNTFTLDGPNDTAYFAVAQDGAPATLNADLAGNATLPWNPNNGGHTLSVTPFDKAGNSGAAFVFKFGVGNAQLISPVVDQASTAVFGVAATGPANSTGGRVEYRVADTGAAWVTASNAKTSNGSTWTGATTQANGASTTGNLNWDARSSTSIIGSKAVEVRVCFTYVAGPDNCAASRVVQLVESAFGGLFPTTQAGPAQVALFTGEAMISAPDALDASVGAGRMFSSFDGATSVDGPFGYGWSSMLLADSEIATASIVDNKTSQKRFVVQIPAWGEQTFSQQGTSNTYAPEGVDDGSRLILNPAGSLLTYVPMIGAEVSWTLTGSEWSLNDVNPDGSASTTVTQNGSTTFVAQVAPGTSAACNLSQQQDGCRGLKITKDGSGHVTQVAQVVAGKADQPLVSYAYTASQLAAVCDLTQGSSWCASYTYVPVNGRTLLAAVAAPGGVKPWRFEYDNTGRLVTVKRELDAATGTGDATWTVKYGLDPSTSGLPTITQTSAADWGQTVFPTVAAAVWLPNRVPAVTPTAADLAYAQVSWMTLDGQTTNTAVNSGSQWLVDTTWYNDQQNPVRTLNGAGWARVQAAAVTDRPGVALQASSFTTYSPAGDRVEDEYGPSHSSTLKDGTTGQFRPHTSYVYDNETTGITVPTPPNGQAAWDLVIDTIASASNPNMTADYDTTVVRNAFDPVVAGDGSGWELGTPTQTSVQLPGGGWSTTITRHNSDGQLIETRQPGGGANPAGVGNDARSTQFVYYTAAVNNTYPECGGKAEWAGLECMHGPAAQPPGNPIPKTFTTSYDRDLIPLVTEDRSGGTTRTTTTVLDSKGRVSTRAQAVSGGNASDPASPTTTYGYDPTTSQLSILSAGGETIIQTYDTWGRPKTYTDAAGMPSTTTYTASGQLATMNDGVGAYTYAYADNRGLPTSIDVGLASGPDEFTLAYDNAGNPTAITYPNGTIGTRTYDEIGVPQTLTYANASTPLIGFTNTTDVAGRTIATQSAASTQKYTYDVLDRLTKVEDTRADACSTRTYGFSSSSERTSKTTYAPNATNGCQTTTPTSSWAGTYDDANRVTNAGYTYDNLGRTRTTPASDTTAQAMGALTTTYYPNDMVASLSQSVDNGTGTAVTKANAYSLDPSRRIDAITSTTSGTETQRSKYRFSAASDAPTSIASSTNAGINWTTTRYIQIPGLGMVGSSTGTATDWNLANLHGDSVATQPNTLGSAIIGSYTETDEYGNALQGTPGRYGYLGTHQRSADTIGGLTLMGARLYNPTTGNFQSIDAVTGGGATRYAYPTNPVNVIDLSGRVWAWVLHAVMDRLVDWMVDSISYVLCSGVAIICGALIAGAVTFVYRLATYHFLSGYSWGTSTAFAASRAYTAFLGRLFRGIPTWAIARAATNMRNFASRVSGYLRSAGWETTAYYTYRGLDYMLDYIFSRAR